jgi:hypothetical protein
MVDSKPKSNPLNEALRRIEQAKLYEALLNHDLFGEDSASPEVVDAVKAEISEFIQTRLEVLLGIRPEPTEASYQSDFEEEEVIALKALAARALQGPQRPTYAQPTQPTITPVTMPSKANKRGKGKRQEEVPVNPPRQKSNNTSAMAIERPDGTKEIIEQDYSQAINPNNPPLKMPSQAIIDQMNAQQAANNAAATTLTAPQMGGVVQTVLKTAERNPNIKEE